VRVLLNLLSLLVLPCLVSADEFDDLRTKYLADPAVRAEIKRAIQQRVVIVGMCPFEAFAAAGRPGLYKVQADKKWPDNIVPPVIINAQCQHPDDSVIELLFHSKTQFNTPEPVVFRVKFEKGRAVLIDQNPISLH
jgi:hypothetical protein